jgi:hypothetical protein
LILLITVLIMVGIFIKIMTKIDPLIACKSSTGNKTFIADIQGGYLVNPATNLKFCSYIYRSFDPTKNTATTFNVSTSWFTLTACRCFNWYFDY